MSANTPLRGRAAAERGFLVIEMSYSRNNTLNSWQSAYFPIQRTMILYMTLDSFFVFIEKHSLTVAVAIIYTALGIIHEYFFFLQKIYFYSIPRPNNINGNNILIPNRIPKAVGHNVSRKYNTVANIPRINEPLLS